MAKISFHTVNDEGFEVEISLPAKYDVCPRCDGEGKHTNPSIDGNGLSREDFDADPDFEEGYFSGLYDVRCEECAGRTTVLVVDEAAVKARGLQDDLKAYREYRRDRRAVEREMAAEREMGA